MQKLLYFDYAAIIIMAVLLLSIIFKNMVRGRLNRVYLILVLASIFTTSFDILAVKQDNIGSDNFAIRRLTHTLYLALHTMATPLHIFYFIVMTGTLFMFINNKRRLAFFLIPIATIMLSLMLNLFNHRVFYFDEDGRYTRGSWFILLYVVTGFYTIYGLIYFIKYRRLLERNRLISFIAGLVVLIMAAGIQYFLPNCLIEMFASAIVLLFILMMVQRTEDNIDTDTGINIMGAYVADMRNSFINHKPESIIMVNIGNYQPVRDMLGYEEMRRVKKVFVTELNNLISERKLKTEQYYVGNGNFRIVLDAKDTDQTEELAQAINSHMKNAIKWKEMEINIIACICIVKCPEDIQDIDSLLAFGYDLGIGQYTGDVLYASKLYKRQYYDIMKDIDKILENAISEHRFEMYYQPIYSVAEKRFNSAEALIRLNDEKYGFISPEIFIPAAEKSGAIYKIGDFVLEEVCSFIGSEEFSKLGLDYIEINLSVAQCMQNNLSNHIISILNKYDVSSDQINLEITETATVSYQNTMLKNINRLNSHGVAFSLDDFGTGYSNMMRIASIPFHIIKLDKTFTKFENNPNMIIVVENTIKMIKAMNMKIVVEGIETEEMLNKFSLLGCEYIQGYYFSKPVPKNQFIEFIQSHHFA